MPLIPTRHTHPAHYSAHPAPFILSLNLESPPLVMYGTHTESSGALLSGLLVLELPSDSAPTTPSATSATSVTSPLIRDASLDSITTIDATAPPDFPVSSVVLALNQIVTIRRPFLPNSSTIASCPDCTCFTTELARWDILAQPSKLPRGRHAYPFSHLLPGSIPATCSLGPHGSAIRYELVARAVGGPLGTPVTVRLPLRISRSILRGPDRHSLRVFPPTTVTATANIPNVVYPKSTFSFELRLDGVCNGEKSWRMRRLSWRIEEHIKVRCHACPKHRAKLAALEAAAAQAARKAKAKAKSRDRDRERERERSRDTEGESRHGTPEISGTSEQNTPVVPPLESPASVAQSPEPFAPLAPQSSATSATSAAAGPAPSPSPSTTPVEVDTSIYQEECRTVAHGDIRSGWKSDFSGSGQIEVVADINILSLSSGLTSHVAHASSAAPPPEASAAANVSCDVDDPTLGIHVHHVLVVELVVAEEFLHAPPAEAAALGIYGTATKKPGRAAASNHVVNPADARLAELSPALASLSGLGPHRSRTEDRAEKNEKTERPDAVRMPTGAARVLRMQFKLVMVERSGLGIAWDDEVPPVYEDVSALSPPAYADAVGGTPSLHAALEDLEGSSSESGRRFLSPIMGVGETPALRANVNLDEFQELNI